MRRATCDVRDRLSTLRLQVTKTTNMCQSQNGFRPLRREFHVSQPTCQCAVLPSDRIGFCLVLWDLGDVTLTIAAEMQSRMSITEARATEKYSHNNSKWIFEPKILCWFFQPQRTHRNDAKDELLFEMACWTISPNDEEKAPALLYAQISFFAIFAFFAAKILRRGVIQQKSKLNHPQGGKVH